MFEKNRGAIRIFACGGAGFNIGAQLERYRGTNEAHVADIDIKYIDTSAANLRKHNNIDKANVYLVSGRDGSGGTRSCNYESIQEHIPDIIKQFRIADLNIVISSASGGSGSVIGPCLTSGLLSKDASVIVIVIGDDKTVKDINNTTDTIKSYAGISRARKAPVVASYFKNSAEKSEQEVNKEVIALVTSLSVLFSKQNHGMDTQDLINWLRYDRVCSYPPMLVHLAVLGSDFGEGSRVKGHPVSVATMADSPDQVRLPELVNYQCEGFLSEEIDSKLRSNTPIHFTISDGVFSNIMDSLHQRIDEIKEAQEAQIHRSTIFRSGDMTDDNGMVI